MVVLMVGDVCGAPGVELIAARLPALRRECGADFVVVNGENATIRGISAGAADAILDAGADVITLGNHAFANRGIFNYLDDNRRIIRPANLPAQRPGFGHTKVECCGKTVCVLNLAGRLYMDFLASDPFAAADRILREEQADLYIVDFHAQATSEKLALGYYLDARVSVVAGTHTHVQTSDARVLPEGAGYITDLGMTGGQLSVLGVRREQSIAYFRGELGERFKSADLDLRIQGAVFELGEDGRCRSARAVDFK